MKIYQTEAIFLQNYSLSEADKIVVCLTKDLGLIRLVAKGARKLKSRFSAGIEPFSIGEIAFYRREDAELGILRHVELQKSYFDFAKNLNLLAAFSYFGELLIEFAPPHEQNSSLYRMAKACLAALAQSAFDTDKTSAAVLYFESWLLRLNGFLPDVRQCAECRRVNSNSESIILTVENRLLCLECGNNRGIVFNSNQIKLMRAVRKYSPEEFVALSAGQEEDVKFLQKLTRKIIRQVVLRDLDYWSERNWELA